MRKTSLSGYFFALILWSISFIGYAADTAQTIPSAATQLAQNDSWDNLTPAQKQTLAPLASEWNGFLPTRRQKWIVIANKIQKMSPEEQKRVQDKMQAWTTLTPAQRTAARENYLRSNKLHPEQRCQHWQEYQQLTDEQKAQLARHHEKKKLITNLPTPAESKIQPLPPLKKPHTKVAPGIVTPAMPAMNHSAP